MLRRLCHCISLLLVMAACLPTRSIGQEAEAPPPVEVEVYGRFYNPNYPDGATTKRLIRLMEQDPELQVKMWGGLSLPGGAGRASLMMAIAGKTAPDIMESWFHIIGNDIRQGFLYPLNEWIGEDQDGNGLVDPDEAIWEPWKEIPPLWRQVVTHEGKIYGIPQAFKYYMGVVYRSDMVRAAGLDPARPPQTWDELIYWCQKLTDPAKEVPGAVLNRGQRGIALPPYGFMWLPWMQSAGGDPIIQIRRSPTTGEEYRLPPDTLTFVTPEGEDLSKQEPEWRANFASPEGIQATELYHKLRWMKWLVDPETGDPIELTDEEARQGFTVLADGRRVDFEQSAIITGVARGQTGQRGTGTFDLLSRGEVAMTTAFVSDLNGIGSSTGLDPDLLSWFPFPAANTESGRRVVQVQNHYVTMVEAVGDRPQAERDKIWKAMTAITDKEVHDSEVREKVLSGLARFVNPESLRELGLEDYLKDVPSSILDNYRGMEEKTIAVFTEPYMGFWVTMDGEINTKVLDLIISDEGEDFDYVAALKRVEADANAGKMFARSQQELAEYRPTARIVFGIIVAIMVFFVCMIIRSELTRKKRNAGSTRQVTHKLTPWLIIAPAVLLIGIWNYYPLVRGMVMAFQDYKVAGESEFVGLSNFISLTLDGAFWKALVRTFYFVFLNMVLAFCAPIVLALMLSEIPVGKYLYRTLFFLPQVTSGLVIALLWKLMYEPTPDGFLNQVLQIWNQMTPTAAVISSVAYIVLCGGIIWQIATAFVQKHEGFKVKVLIASVILILLVVFGYELIFPTINLMIGNTTVIGSSLIVEPQTWLQDPKIAMLCCVIPTVWASMGMASLIYLAALKAVPDELYEAADVDGAGIMMKLKKITLPTLLPLVIINFVGAFIGTFQNMGNIFLMTFGGPGDATEVIGLLIWKEAYNNLRFSMATSMAWVLGALLIGFTYVQIQFLKRVEFRKSEWD